MRGAADRGALPGGELRRLAGLARGLGLVPLVETHGARTTCAGRTARGTWELVGVNNRDLRTFDVDLARSGRLVPRCRRGPAGRRERHRHRRRRRAPRDAGFDAFLIGESLLLADDPAAQLQELVG